MSKPKILKELNVGKANAALYQEDNGASWLRMSYGGTRLFIVDYDKNQQATALSQWTIVQTVVRELVACFEQADASVVAKLRTALGFPEDSDSDLPTLVSVAIVRLGRFETELKSKRSIGTKIPFGNATEDDQA